MRKRRALLRLCFLRCCHRLSLLAPRMHYAVTACPTTADFAYYRWLRANYPSRRMLRRLRRGGKSARGPLISIVMPVFRPPPHCLRAAIDSALRQSYRNWELCIVDDGSADAAVREVLAEYEQGEPRIRIRLEAENRGISAASNRALAQASGEFVTFVDHDDVLPEHALQRIADVLVEHPSTDVLYTDEDKCTSPFQVESPFFKPDWCPDSLLSRMYTMHLAVYRRSLLNELGGLRSEFDGAQDYDLILRASELTGEIRHLPEVLYHWRILPASIASGPDNPKAAYAYDAAERALADALRRRHASATVVPIDGLPCAFRVRYTITAHERVSIHIASRDNAALLERCVNSIRERTRYENYEIVLVDHGSREASTVQLIDRWKADPCFRSVSIDIPFNYSQPNHLAVERSSGRFSCSSMTTRGAQRRMDRGDAGASPASRDRCGRSAAPFSKQVHSARRSPARARRTGGSRSSSAAGLAPRLFRSGMDGEQLFSGNRCLFDVPQKRLRGSRPI